MKLKLLFSLLFLTLFIFSCEEDEEDNPTNIDIGQKYLSHHLGKSWTYKIDSIVYDDFSQTIDTFKFQRRIVLEEIISEDMSSKTYKTAIYERASDTLNWIKLKYNSWLYSKRNFIDQNDNIQLLRLIIPPTTDGSWDGNAFNSRPEQMFYFSNLYETLTVNNSQFDSVITVIQQSETNLIEQKYTAEKFAPFAGMIHRQDRQLETELNGDITKGFDVTYLLLDYN